MRARRVAILALAIAAALATIANGSLRLLFGPGEHARDWDQHTAYAEAAARAVRVHGELPFWNPMPCGGIPTLANPQSRVLTPFFLLHLVTSASVALRLEIVLHSFFGALGAALFAHRLVRGRGRVGLVASALAAFGFACTTAFTLHVAEGHSWILAGAYTPWALFAFDKAIHARDGRLHHAALAGACLAAMLGEGGIYPLPHTALALAAFAVAAAVERSSMRPIVCLAVAGVVCVLLGAPKLLPMLEFMSRYPRRLASDESLGLGSLVSALVSHDQRIDRPGVPWGWHEVGSYVGVVAIVLALIAAFGRDHRRAWIAMTAGTFVAFAAGSFSAYAPWRVLHHLPVFASQHVPSRFLFVAVVLVFVLASVGVCDVARRAPRRWRLAIAAGAVAFVAIDVAWATRGVLRPPERAAEPWPDDAPRGAPFVTLRGYRPPPASGNDVLVEAVRRDVGLIDAYEPACPRFDAKSYFGRRPGLLGRDERGYRGEAWLVDADDASVRVVARTSNTITVELDAPRPARVVFDMNGDPGFSADVGKVSTDPMVRLVWDAPATHGPERHVLRYRPPYLGAGIVLFVLGLAAAVASYRVRTKPYPPASG